MTNTIDLLDQTLTYWEDMNKSALLRNLLTMIAPENVKQEEIPLHGSELTQSYVLVKEIPGYKKVREILEKNNPQLLMNDDREWLFPHIPTKMKEEFKDSRMRFALDRLPSAFFIPYVLMDWAINKKVCSIENNASFPLAPMSSGNYLDKLPYDCFLLQISEPITFKAEIKNIPVELEFGCFIIQRVQNVITVFGIPSSIAEECYTENDNALADKAVAELERCRPAIKNRDRGLKHERSIMKSAMKAGDYLKKMEEDPDFKMSQMFTFLNFIDAESGEYDFFCMSAVNFADIDGESQIFLEEVLFTLNGFCKALAEHKSSEILNTSLPKNSVESSTRNKETKTEMFNWFEVPVNNIDYMKVRIVEGSVEISVIRRGEKSPHVRRGFERTYLDKNGLVKKRVWVNSTVVRRDKLEKGEQSKSGKMVIQ